MSEAASLSGVRGVRLTLASPQQIRAWSWGEVTRSETLNYLTMTPEPGGLLCERIFGPLKDWTCACGIRHPEQAEGRICAQCGVTITKSRVRRERMGHIELAMPIVHRWCVRGAPSVLATLLALTPRQLASVIDGTGYLVISLHEEERADILARPHAHIGSGHRLHPRYRQLATLITGTFLDEEQYQALRDLSLTCVQAQTGVQAIRICLQALDLPELAATLRASIEEQGKESKGGKRGDQAKKAIKRLQLVEALLASGVSPSWMVLDVLPVLPPDLRPLISLGGGRLACSDLNTLYTRVLNRNARIMRLMARGAPSLLLRYEQRLLQHACDALFDNLHSSRPLTNTRGQPLKSLTDALTGKQGRFRRHLLGKRVDYSGRSVIAVGVDLRLHECGLPKSMALELFKPFVIRKLLDRHLTHTPRGAKRMVERHDPLVWDQLAECLHEKVVLLNRAPTLHRLSLQAFEPKLVEGNAIRLHPLVCSAFNADFDGDQMAVHLPLSDEAQAEARRLLLSVRNLRSPATGEPAISLSQEIVLGCFYLTEARPSRKPKQRIFVDADEARLAYEQGAIDLHTPIVVRIADQQVYEVPPPASARSPERGRIQTTLGRLLFNEVLPPALRYRNYAMTKEGLKQLIAESLINADEQTEEATAKLADALKQLGYRYATKSGISFGMGDMQEPVERQQLVAQGQARAADTQRDEQQGIITPQERDQCLIALWSDLTEQISQHLLAQLDPWGTISTIVKSGATKAKFQQIRQLSGIRGLMADPSGRVIPIPVLGNYRRGLSTSEVFIAARGARKGFMDRSLNTAPSGYLTRKLVEVGMEVWTTQEDCGTSEDWLITNEESQAQGLPDLRSRIVGRVLAEAVGGLPAGTLLSEVQVEALWAAGVTAVRVRSPFTCQAEYGICCRCYGRDLATSKLVKQGVAVGIIAGQSIGEPGTQLTMRTFHSGGIANAQGDITQGLPRVSELFEARTSKGAALLAENDGVIHIKQHAQTGKTVVHLISDCGSDASDTPVKQPAEQVYELAPVHTLLVEDGQSVHRGTALTTGACHPPRILELQGREAAAHALVSEVQRIYRASGVYTNDKHLECIVRQMLRYVLVTEPGDSSLLPGDLVNRFQYGQVNAATLAQGGAPALARPVLLGLTRTALQTASWIAAASFQETSRVLTAAALGGQLDPLRGYKERIVLGLPIPTSVP